MSLGPHAGRPSGLAPAIAVCSALGTLELLVRASVLRPPGRELLPALVFTIVAYAGFGLTLFLVAWLVRIRRPALLSDPESVIAFPVGGWTAAVAYGLLAESGASVLRLAFLVVLALALGWATFTLIHALVRHFPSAARTAVWMPPTALGLVLCAGLFLAGRPPSRSRVTVASGIPSVLLVTIDTLRADRVGAYGYKAARTPTFDALAAHGYLFEQAIAPSILTGPSHASILSGKLLATHGVTENSLRIPSDLQTLADIMGSRGVETAAFVSGEPLSTTSSGIPARFAHYSDDFRTFRGLPETAYRTAAGKALERALRKPGRPFRPYSRPADDVTRDAVDWLSKPRTAPFVAWVHYYDPHLPYEPPARLLSPETLDYSGPAVGDWYSAKDAQRAAIVGSPAAMRQMMRLYDAEVAFADEQLGILVAAARAQANDAGVWIVVTSDHGESFGEHGNFFWRDLYDDTLLVPLAIVPPTGLPQGVRVKSQVGLIDVAPTLCELLLHAPAPSDMDGVSLTPFFRGQTSPPRQAVSLIVPSRTRQYDRVHLSVRTETWKAIFRAPGWDAGRDHLWLGPTRELYDLARDPGELQNDAAAHAVDVWPAMEAAAAAQAHAPARAPLTSQQLEMLRSLGYVH
jgi:arylsulfatase A-like enzyme